MNFPPISPLKNHGHKKGIGKVGSKEHEFSYQIIKKGIVKVGPKEHEFSYQIIIRELIK